MIEFTTMTVNAEAWQTLLSANAHPAVCACLRALANSRDHDSIAHAIAAGVPAHGSTEERQRALSEVLHLLNPTEGKDQRGDEEGVSVVNAWLAATGSDEVGRRALVAAIEGGEYMPEAVAFLATTGIDIYAPVHRMVTTLDGTRGQSLTLREDSAAETLIRLAYGHFINEDQACELAAALLGSDAITEPSRLPDRMRAVEKSIEKPVNFLVAAAVAEFHNLTRLVGDRIDVDEYPEAQRIYFDLGSSLLETLGINIEDGEIVVPGSNMFSADDRRRMSAAFNLIFAGAEFEQGKPVWEAVALRLADQLSSLFVALTTTKTSITEPEVERDALFRAINKADLSVDTLFNGETLLMRAAFAGHAEYVEALLAAGADPRIVATEPSDFPGKKAIEFRHSSWSDPMLGDGPAISDRIVQMLDVAAAKFSIDNVINTVKSRAAAP